MSANECECCINLCESSHSDKPNPAVQSMWYDWWWNYQHNLYQGERNNVTTHYAAWCTTCVEEQKLRQERGHKLTNGRHAYTTHDNTNNSISNSPSPFNPHERYARSNDVTGNYGSHDIGEMSYDEDDNDDEFEMELNNDFKRFLEQSARHKEQRKKQKEADIAKAEADNYIEVNEIALEATTIPPTQQQGVLRTEEMKALYGKSAHNIESLETSLQLHFNMNVDMRHPVFWPSIPLKF